MRVSELAGRVAKMNNMDAERAVESVHAVLDALAAELQESGECHLHGFGSFRVVERKARRGRNPKTGESIEIPARKAVRWSASRAFQRQLGFLGDAAPTKPLTKTRRRREVAQAKAYAEKMGGTATPAQPSSVEPLPEISTVALGHADASTAQVVDAPPPISIAPQVGLTDDMMLAGSSTPAPTTGAPADGLDDLSGLDAMFGGGPATAAPAAPSAPPPAPAVPAEDPMVKRAERTAKVMVDDMFLYKGEALKAAKTAGQDPLSVVEEELTQARETLKKRVGDVIAAKRDFIGEAFAKKAELL